jgi:hypothetical protein
MLIGAAIFATGLILRFAPGLLAWFGKLPGDIRYEGERSRFFFPITSMIVVSVVLTAIVNLIRIWRGR